MERDRVGIRALQQHASEVVRRAAAGEVIDITDRGRLVARIVPAKESGLEALRAAGLVRPATRSWADLPPLVDLGPGPSMSEILDEMREDRL